MKTTNWQTKALALFIAAAALWLVSACGEEATNPGINISSQHCVPGLPSETSEEFKQFEYFRHGPDVTRTERENQAIRLRAERLKPETERIQAILDRYIEHINRDVEGSIAQYVIGYMVESLKDRKGRLTDTQVILIHFGLYEGQFPLKYPIPKCIEDVIVHSIIWQPRPSR